MPRTTPIGARGRKKTTHARRGEKKNNPPDLARCTALACGAYHQTACQAKRSLLPDLVLCSGPSRIGDMMKSDGGGDPILPNYGLSVLRQPHSPDRDRSTEWSKEQIFFVLPERCEYLRSDTKMLVLVNSANHDSGVPLIQKIVR